MDAQMDLARKYSEKYSVNNYDVGVILNWYRSGEIAIPEIQRPFIWETTKVRDLLDSLYRGYPVGYLIVWKNPNVKLKDGSSSEGKKILIDGQQRVTALITSILAQEVVNQDYRKTRIAIAFNPQKEEFNVQNPAILKDSAWLSDISPIIRGKERTSKVTDDYCSKNPSADAGNVEDAIENLKNVMSRPIGLIELTHDLDIETVTDIFIRINSKGVSLNQADFAMSKIASNESLNGTILRKCIDYFCHLMRRPEAYETLKNADPEFTKTDYFQKLMWLKNENEDLYEPNYSDMLRVAFTSEFNRGKLADLVSLLSGRNFETKQYDEEIEKDSYRKLGDGLIKFINENNFKRFIMILKSAGFISPDLISSQNAVNFAYILYLKLKSQNHNPADIERYVRKWFVLSILTERYSASPESQFDFDIKNSSRTDKDFKDYFKEVEASVLSDSYWNVTLVQNLETQSISSPYFNVFLSAQVKFNHKGFLSKEITVRNMIDQRGDIHHIFPREYLKDKGFKREYYNQIANYVYAQTEINIKIGKKAPKDYFAEIQKQCNGGQLIYGGICSTSDLKVNLQQNCIPEEVATMDSVDFKKFLELRRVKMSKLIHEYYNSL